MSHLRNDQILVLMHIRDTPDATLQEIADRIGTTKGQVGSRLSEIYKRLGIAWMDQSERRAAAVRRADKLGELPDHVAPIVVDLPTGELL